MERVYARASVGISELKKNPSRIIQDAAGTPVAILNHNKPSAYLVPAETFEALIQRLEQCETRSSPRSGKAGADDPEEQR